MGPADPFANRDASHQSPPPRPSESERSSSGARPHQQPSVGAAAAWGGFAVGVLLGVLALLFGLGPALLVLALGGVSALLAWLADGIRRGALDPLAAWRALRR